MASEATQSSEGKKEIDGFASAPLQGDSKEPVAWFSFSRCVGPGLLACLADTDAGCLMVAAQSGAKWGYSLGLLQLLLIPVLFAAQELTVRLGVYTQMGHAGCIKQYFGTRTAWFTTTLLAAEGVLATVSEMSGIAAVMELWGMTRLVGTLVAAVTVVTTVFLCKYRQIEVIGITLGLFELTFVVTMVYFHPSPSEIFAGLFTFHFDESEYLKLYAANMGAVIMPFMIYFQQSAVVARRLSVKEVAGERAQTFLGCCLTQLIMIATIVTYAASRAKNLSSISDMHMALVPVFGILWGKVLISMALIGGSLCATFVVSLAASWAICDTAGWDDAFSVDLGPTEAPYFYGVFLCIVLIGVGILQTGVGIVTLNVFIELVNGLLMPIVIGLLFVMACSDMLPAHVRVVGTYKVVLGILFLVCSATTFGAGVSSLLYPDYVPPVRTPPGLFLPILPEVPKGPMLTMGF